MTGGQAKVLILGAIVGCSAIAFYRGNGFDPRRISAIAILGAALLFTATFAPGPSGIGALLLIADSLVLEPTGTSVVDGIAATVLPGATSNTAGKATTTGPLGAFGSVAGAGAASASNPTATSSKSSSSTSALAGIEKALSDFKSGNTGWQKELQSVLGKLNG